MMKTNLQQRTVTLPAGERVSAYGQGTWRMGEDAARRGEEIATLQLGLDLGANLIDTAEMYGEGSAEEMIGEAIAGRRDETFLVSKVYPHHATRRGTIAACKRSLKRLRTDRLDLYLLHWRGAVPLAETIDAFVALQETGLIRFYGVSNLDLADMQELAGVEGGKNIATNQVLYNLAQRGIEGELLPWLRARRIPLIAYSPIEEGRLANDAKLVTFAQRHGMTAGQAAIAWLLANDDIIVIPKTSRRERLKENIAARQIQLTAGQLAELDELFPPPAGSTPLAMH